MKKLSLLLLLSTLCACASRPKEPLYINIKPKLDPLSAEVSRAMQPNSTELLKRAGAWSESSRQLLDSVKPN